jgi:SHS2 domain-containing protein
MPYRHLDHTADLCIRVEETSLKALFRTAGLAMMDQIVDRGCLSPEGRTETEASGSDREDLLFHWLRELLWLWNGEGKLVRDISVETFGDTRLRAVLDWQPYDARRHRLKREIKAVTYHGLRVQRQGLLWSAQIVFDV